MDRQELFSLLSDAMRGGTPEAFGGTMRTSTVKSRLLEAHPAEASSEGCGALLKEVAAEAGIRLDALATDLWALVGSKDSFIFDTLNPRFWMLHSTSQSSTVQSVVQQLLVSDPRLDRAWLSPSQLGELEGERRWIRSSFQSDELRPGAEDQSGVPRRWRIQVEGEEPDELLRLVRQQPRYEASASLTAVGCLIREEGVGHAQIAADYMGRFASSGTTFELVVGLLWRSLDRYESYIKNLESQYRLGASPVGSANGDGETLGLSIEGDVAVLEFPDEVRNVEGFLGGLFNCREPFRLWALPHPVASNQWEANAVDLHVGHPLRIEVTPRWMRVLLDETTCGNTLARLVANLQHRFDARMALPEQPVAA